MNDELLPCPCCGGEAGFQIFDKICNIECQNCFIGTRFESIDNAELVVETWNKRVKRYPESLAQRMIADGYEYELFELRKERDEVKKMLSKIVRCEDCEEFEPYHTYAGDVLDCGMCLKHDCETWKCRFCAWGERKQ